MSSTSVGSRRNAAERIDEIVDLVGGQREPEARIRRLERGAAVREHRHGRERLRCRVREQPARRSDASSTPSVMRSWIRAATASRSGSVSARDPLTKYAMPRSMRRTAPRPHTCAMSVALLDHGDTVPNRGTTRQQFAARLRGRSGRAVAQQGLEHARLVGGEFACCVDEVDVACPDGGDVARAFAEGGQELLEAEIRKRGSAAESEHLRGRPPFNRGAK